MPVAIDTSVLIAWERSGSNLDYLSGYEGPFYVPAHAAAEFLVGIHPPVTGYFRERARRLYETQIKHNVTAFSEADAAQLAALIADLRLKGQQMKFFDAAIAATVMARKDALLVADSDFERLRDAITILNYPPTSPTSS